MATCIGWSKEAARYKARRRTRPGPLLSIDHSTHSFITSCFSTMWTQSESRVTCSCCTTRAFFDQASLPHFSSELTTAFDHLSHMHDASCHHVVSKQRPTSPACSMPLFHPQSRCTGGLCPVPHSPMLSADHHQQLKVSATFTSLQTR